MMQFLLLVGLPVAIIALNIFKSFHDRKTKILAEREKLIVYAKLRGLEVQERDKHFELQRTALEMLAATKKRELEEKRQQKREPAKTDEVSTVTPASREVFLHQEPVPAPSTQVALPDASTLEDAGVFISDED